MRTYGSPTWALRLYIKIQGMRESLRDARGQDLIEYAIVAALISLGAVVSVKGVATAIGSAYSRLGTKFASYTS